MKDKNDQRKASRSAFKQSIKLTHNELGEFKIFTKNISTIGALFLCDHCEKLTIGDIVNIQPLDIDDAPEIQAKVVRFDSDGFGVEYL